MKKIALIGATGNVGQKVLETIHSRKSLPIIEITPIGSEKSAGQLLESLNKNVIHIDQVDWSTFDLAIFTTSAETSCQFIPIAIAAGCKVIDSSSHYRMDHKVPLIVAPVNGNSVLTSDSSIFATANCIASPISIIMDRLSTISPIKRIVLSTYQSVSGAGKEPMRELMTSSTAFVNDEPFKVKHFQKDIAFNVIPQIDTVHTNGHTGEETKIMLELKKILNTDLKIAVQSVRVPVFVGHSISVFLEFENACSVSAAKTALKQSPHISVVDDILDFRTPREVAGSDLIYVSRLRVDTSVNHGLIFWSTSDNLRRGAALDVVETAEILLTA